MKKLIFYPPSKLWKIMRKVVAIKTKNGITFCRTLPILQGSNCSEAVVRIGIMLKIGDRHRVIKDLD